MFALMYSNNAPEEHILDTMIKNTGIFSKNIAINDDDITECVYISSV